MTRFNTLFFASFFRESVLRVSLLMKASRIWQRRIIDSPFPSKAVPMPLQIER
jgi:hypothetical protein